MITCVIPTKNEAYNLPYALATLRWCSEVIVVDMESTDGTPELARQWGAKVIEVATNPLFDWSRKVGLDAARNVWVLALDADEMVPPRLAQVLHQGVSAGDCDAFRMARLNFKLGPQKGGGLWPDYQRRLYRRTEVSFASAIHDYLALAPTARIRTLPPDEALALHHFNYQPIAQQVDKLNRYTSADVCHGTVRRELPRHLPLKTMMSLYLKHGGWRDGLPGFWWAFHQAMFYWLLRTKTAEFKRLGTLAAAEAQIAQANVVSTRGADRRGRSPTVDALRDMPARLVRATLRMLASSTVDRRNARQACMAAFRDVVTDVKVWETATGRHLAERAQQEGRARLLAEWGASTFAETARGERGAGIVVETSRHGVAAGAG